MRLVLLLCGGLLAAMPAAGQTILGVLGGTAVNADDPGAVVTINPNNGAATVLGTPIPGESLTGVAMLNDGRVLASTATFTGPSRLIEIDPATGALIADIGAFSDGKLALTIHDLTVDPKTGILYGASIGEGDRPAGEAGSQRQSSSHVTTGIGSPTDVNAIFAILPNNAQGTFIGTPANLQGDFLALGYGNGLVQGVPANAAVMYGMFPGDAQPDNEVAITGSDGDGALGLAFLPGGGEDPQFLFSGCCANSVGNQIYQLDFNTGVATLLGSAGGTRRVHDMVVIPAVGPGAAIVDVPVLGKQGIAALVLLLALGGAFLLKRR